MALYAAFFKKQYLVVEEYIFTWRRTAFIEWQWKIREKRGSTIANASIASVHARVSCAVDSSTTDAIRMVASFFGRRSSTALLGFGMEIVNFLFFFGFAELTSVSCNGLASQGRIMHTQAACADAWEIDFHVFLVFI